MPVLQQQVSRLERDTESTCCPWGPTAGACAVHLLRQPVRAHQGGHQQSATKISALLVCTQSASRLPLPQIKQGRGVNGLQLREAFPFAKLFGMITEWPPQVRPGPEGLVTFKVELERILGRDINSVVGAILQHSSNYQILWCSCRLLRNNPWPPKHQLQALTTSGC
jgi:hypothetical protein